MQQLPSTSENCYTSVALIGKLPPQMPLAIVSVYPIAGTDTMTSSYIENAKAKLRAAGVHVEQKTYAGVTHEFFGMGAVIDSAKAAEQMAADALKKAFADNGATRSEPRSRSSLT